jgi:hypothetical protein
MKKAELIFATLSILALGLSLLSIPGFGFLSTMLLMTLAVFYFYFGFALFNEIRLRNIFQKDSYKNISPLRIIGAVGVGFALSSTLIGIMFTFQNWTGAKINLGVGLVSLLIIVIIATIKYAKTKADFYTCIFKRVAIFGGLGLILIALPDMALLDFKYRNHPAYLDALKKATAEPNNKALWDKVDEEQNKIDLDETK